MHESGYLSIFHERASRRLLEKSVRHIQRATNGHLTFSGEALENIGSYLLNRCAELLAPTLAIKLAILPDVLEELRDTPCTSSAPASVLQRAVGRLSFDSDPHVEKIALRAVTLSTRNLIQAFERIVQNRHAVQNWLHQEPKRIEKIRIHNGETHNRGGQVVVVHFSQGAIVYKPVDLRPQQFFFQVCKNVMTVLGLNAKGGPEVIVPAPRFGIMEYVETLNSPPNSDTCKRFYYRTGVLLAVAHCLKVIDIHYDNLFMTPSGPVVLDVETLFYPFPEGYSPTVLDTQLIGDKKYAGIEGGGSLKKIGIHARLSSNRLIVDYAKPVFMKNNRIPGAEGVRLIDPAEFRVDIREGFRAGYMAIYPMKNVIFDAARCLLKKNISCRYLPRNTAYYLVKQLSLIQPRHAGTRKHLQRVKSALARNLTIKHCNTSRLVQREIQDLLNADIPYFYTKSLTRHLYSASTIACDNYLADSQLKRLQKYYLSVSIKDMEDQLRIIEEA